MPLGIDIDQKQLNYFYVISLSLILGIILILGGLIYYNSYHQKMMYNQCLIDSVEESFLKVGNVYGNDGTGVGYGYIRRPISTLTLNETYNLYKGLPVNGKWVLGWMIDDIIIKCSSETGYKVTSDVCYNVSVDISDNALVVK